MGLVLAIESSCDETAAAVVGEDLFVHYSYICMDGYRSLKAGQQVTYDEREAPKGLHAVNINVIEADKHRSSSQDTQTESTEDADSHQHHNLRAAAV